MNISELDTVRPDVGKNVKFSPAEYRAFWMGWSRALERAQAVTELAGEEFERRERMRRRWRKMERGA